MPIVPIEEMPPCAGNGKAPCGKRDFSMIKGYDGRFRCRRCNAIHIELVFREAGDSMPTSAGGSIVAKVESDVKRRDDIVKKYRVH